MQEVLLVWAASFRISSELRDNRDLVTLRCGQGRLAEARTRGNCRVILSPWPL